MHIKKWSVRMSTVISYLEVDRGIAWWLGSADTTRPAEFETPFSQLVPMHQIFQLI
jgi:hypothetical protein